MTKHNGNLLILNGVAVAVYFAVFFNLDVGVDQEIMFSSPDSRTYWAVANWLDGGARTIATSIRPISYPLVLLASMKISGVYGVWILQSTMWLLTVNLVFGSLHQLTGRYVFGFLGAGIIISNLSLIALTLHAVTEVITTFSLSLLVYFISRNANRWRDLYFFHGCLAILALMTTIKPVFFIPVELALLVVLPVFYLKKYISYPKKLLFLIVVLLPIFIQMTIMKLEHNDITVSWIGSRTLNTYFLAQGIQDIENLDRKRSIARAIRLSNQKKFDYMLENKRVFSRLFFHNVLNNIDARANFLNYPKKFEHKALSSYMVVLNRIYLYLHLVFLLPVSFLLLRMIKTKDYNNLTVMVITTSLCAYYVVSTGISFWQGDRLVLPAIAIWPVIYLFAIFCFIQMLSTNRSEDDISV